MATNHRVVPVIRTLLADEETPLSVYRKLADDQPGTFLLESAAPGQSWSRYSFIGAGSSCALSATGGEVRWIGTPPVDIAVDDDPFQSIKLTLDALHTEEIPGLPPLTSGLVGYMGYDMIRYIEKVSDTTDNDLHIPDMIQMLVQNLAVLDHHEGSIWLISNAINWNNTAENADDAYNKAIDQLDAMQAKLAQPNASTITQFSMPAHDARRQISQEDYIRRILEAKEYIVSGDAFQVVLSQRFEMDTGVAGLDIYRMLRVTNPSPYMYLLNMPSDDFAQTRFQIIGSSPESLVTVKDGEISSFPIAGSRPRGKTLEEDERFELQLQGDEKEQSEHLMLVDLSRNDIGKVSRAGSVGVHDFRHVERYSHIMHLVSTVTGKLLPDKDAVDAFIATFPAGTLSGAPKPSALQIIDTLELTRRGIYGGTVGYFDFSGDADQAISIRTGLYMDGTVYVQSGAGLVYDSDPVVEDEESQNKAAAVLSAVAAAQTLDSGH